MTLSPFLCLHPASPLGKSVLVLIYFVIAYREGEFVDTAGSRTGLYLRPWKKNLWGVGTREWGSTEECADILVGETGKEYPGRWHDLSFPCFSSVISSVLGEMVLLQMRYFCVSRGK